MARAARRWSSCKARGASLAITVDCGAQAFEALAEAAAAGLDVIVCDHHQCASALPTAVALINPNRLDESDEGAAHGHLAAVGMAFLLGVALLRELRRRGRFSEAAPEPSIIDLLDLVALGTVADVAQLKIAQPRLRHPGAQGDGPGPQHRARRARRGGAAGQGAVVPRPRLRARPADQRRRPRRQVRPRRAPADRDRSRGSARHRRRARPPQRGTPRDRDAGRRAGRRAGRAPGQRPADHRRRAGLARRA